MDDWRILKEDILDIGDFDNIVKVIRCKDCGYYNLRRLTCNRPFESMTNRSPDDYCSMAQRRNE